MSMFGFRLMALLCALVVVVGCGSDEPSESSPPDDTERLHVGEPPLAEQPKNVVGGFVAQLPSVTLQPGEEAFPCWVLPLSVDGPSRIVGGALLTTTYGLHHGNVTSRPAQTPGDGVRECDEETAIGGSEALDIATGGAWLFASSTQVEGDEWQSFRDGLGFRVNDGHEMVAHMHYLNTTSEPITLAPKYEWFTIDESKVAHVLSPFGFFFGGFSIPPMSKKTVTGNCELPNPFHIVHLLPHMHALGTAFTAEFLGGERDGELFLDSQGYDPESGVSKQYNPHVDLGISDGVRFSCSWDNHFDKTIVEGTGDNEMCMLFGYGYSTEPTEPVYMGFAYGEGDCAAIAVPPTE